MKHHEINKTQMHRLHGLRSRFLFVIFCVLIGFMTLTGALMIFLIQSGWVRLILHNPLMIVILVYLLSFLVSTVLSFYVTRSILIPIEQLSEASKKVAQGDFSVQIPTVSDTEELNVTFTNFNNMVKEPGSIETLRNDFIANVSHEFKTPLSAIEGYAMLLQEENITPKERKECAEKILQSANRLNDLTGNILLLSKLENQSYPQEKKWFRLDEQIREAILTYEPAWSSKNIEFDCEMPDMMYYGNERILTHVWNNLIGNAIKFVEQDTGKIKVSIAHGDADSMLNVTVTDNGVGMDQDTMQHIFEKFYQGDTSWREQGNGLGLALCRQIVERCGGGILVRSTPGVGSSFTVSLPVFDADSSYGMSR